MFTGKHRAPRPVLTTPAHDYTPRHRRATAALTARLAAAKAS